MTAQELLDELLYLKEEYGSLTDIPVCVFIANHDRLEIIDIDTFTKITPETGISLHSIDLNSRYYSEEY